MPTIPHTDAFELNAQSANFPTALCQTHPPIRQLFGRGNQDLLCKMAVSPGLAIVGSRQASAQGLADARWFARIASEAGLTIISGLAQGIDAAAHSGGLEGEGKTIAVLGHGLQTIYPAQHRDLSETIVTSGGALISEYPSGTPALAHHFPQRNRIIAALARAVLVVEATPKSGSLITARHALEIGVDVFVLPGSIHMTQSTGCNSLIRQGAQLTQSPEQLLEDLGFKNPNKAPINSLSPELAKRHRTNGDHGHRIAQSSLTPTLDPMTEEILKWLTFHPTKVNDLEIQSGIATKDLYGGLLVLELCGLATRTADGKWLKHRQIR